jgi:hypothetical protein
MCGFQLLLHRYTSEGFRIESDTAAIGFPFEQHDAWRRRISQTEGRMDESDPQNQSTLVSAQPGALLDPKSDAWAVPPKASRRRSKFLLHWSVYMLSGRVVLPLFKI